MTLPSFFPIVPGRLRDDPEEIALWSDTARRERERSVRTGAVVTSACVAGGFAIAMAALPSSDTPGRVARAFIEARYEEDWPAAWDAMCSAGRDQYGSYRDFTEWVAYLNDYYLTPTDVDVEIGDIRAVREPGAHGFGVAYRVTSSERSEAWADGSEALVVREDGEFRVCAPGRSTEVG